MVLSSRLTLAFKKGGLIVNTYTSVYLWFILSVFYSVLCSCFSQLKTTVRNTLQALKVA